MADVRDQRVIGELRARIGAIEGGGRRRCGVLPFGIAVLDRGLPGGGLALGALHEVNGEGPDLAHAAAPALFVAGVLARLEGPVLWCLRRGDLFAPALAEVGLHPDRVIYAESGGDAAVLPVMEEGLRYSGLAAVVGEAARLPLVAGKRLQLAAEISGAMALVIRRCRRRPEGIAEPTAAVTRWRVAVLPSAPLAMPGLGRPRWRLELLRCRGGGEGAWIVEACDAAGRLAVAADVADRPAAPAARRAGG